MNSYDTQTLALEDVCFLDLYEFSNFSLWLKSSPLTVCIKFYWNMAMPIYLSSVDALALLMQNCRVATE